MRMTQTAVIIAAVIAASSSSSSSAFHAHNIQSLSKYRHGDHYHAEGSMTTALHAFRLKEGETENMFEGPLPLVRERDACGVGFIANVNSGGEFALSMIEFNNY